MATTEDKEDYGVWVKTEPTLDGIGGYMITIEATEDIARTLTQEEAVNYATALLYTINEAEYDAAVFRQMTRKLKLDIPTAGKVVEDLRSVRIPVDEAVTSPFVFTGGVNSETKPFIIVMCPGAGSWQWDVTSARAHAMGVLDAIAISDLDSAYLQEMVVNIGLDDPHARGAIEDLRNHRYIPGEED